MKTQNQHKLLFHIFFLIVSLGGFAQVESVQDEKTFQLSFVHPIGSNGFQSGEIANKFSLNILAGYTGGVSSLEIGGIYNVTKGHVKGIQISGFGNAVGGNVDGLQIAGFISTNKGSIEGVQISGFLNLVTNPVKGTQIAGFANLSKSNEGVQIAGFQNHNKETEGLQLAGFINTSGDVKGAQVAGFINIARHQRGVQVGVINVADSIASGAQVGLINISKKNGFISLGVETDDFIPYRVVFRSGQERFYTSIVAGVNTNDDYWALGAGFGSRMSLAENKNVFFNPEVRWEQIGKGKNSYDDFSHLTKLNLNVAFDIQKRLFITAGPSINFYITDYLDGQGQPIIHLANHQMYDKLSRGTRRQLWLGYNIGIGFRL